MQPLCRLLVLLALAVSPAAHAGGLVVVSSGGASSAWLILAAWAAMQPRPVPEISPYHIQATATPARTADSCTFVAGVRHCPLPKLRAEPR
jgi:hypothetical protein